MIFLKSSDISDKDLVSNIAFVFDSKPPPEKEDEREQRSIARQKNNERIKEILKNWEDFLEKEKEKDEYSLEDFKEYLSLFSFLPLP